MGALLGFAPFIGFAVTEQLFGILTGLVIGTVVSIALLARDRSRGQGDINLLEAGSAFMFGALAIAVYAGLGGAWSIWPTTPANTACCNRCWSCWRWR